MERNFYADPFDPRFVEGTAERKHTPLGAMLQCFGFMRTRLLEMCPDAVAFIEDNSLE